MAANDLYLVREKSGGGYEFISSSPISVTSGLVKISGSANSEALRLDAASGYGFYTFYTGGVRKAFLAWTINDPVNASGTATVLKSESGKLHLQGSTGSGITIDSSGYTGVGILSPVEKFHVSGSAPSLTSIRNITENTSSSGFSSVLSKNDGGYFFGTFLQGSATNYFGTGTEGCGFFYMSPSFAMGFITNDLIRMYILNDGKIGIGTTSPNSTLHANGSFSLGLVTKTANYTATASDCIILCDSTSSPFTITLPTAASITGRQYIIKDWKGTSGTFNITIDANGSEKIDGALTYTINTAYSSLTIVSDGTNWSIV